MKNEYILLIKLISFFFSRRRWITYFVVKVFGRLISFFLELFALLLLFEFDMLLLVAKPMLVLLRLGSTAPPKFNVDLSDKISYSEFFLKQTVTLSQTRLGVLFPEFVLL